MADLRVAREVLVLGAVSVLAVVSAVGVIYSVHTSRKMVNELQSLQRAAEQAQVEWGQLLLEKSAWGSYANVEQTARGKLDMYVPSVQEIVVTGP